MLRTTIIFAFLCLSLTSIAGKEHSHAAESEDESVRNKALTSKIWWNQTQKIKEISLTEEQRHQMNHILGDYLREFTIHSKGQKEAFVVLGEALNSGNSILAAEQQDKLSKLTATSVSQQVGIMIKVVALLTDEQRVVIGKKYPLLFNRLWLKAANPASIQGGSNERKGTRKKKPNKN